MEERCAAIFDSIHYVIKGEKMLRDAGLPIDVIPVPREISSDCGMALAFPCENRDRVEQRLTETDVTMVGIYRLHQGQYRKL